MSTAESRPCLLLLCAVPCVWSVSCFGQTDLDAPCCTPLQMLHCWCLGMQSFGWTKCCLSVLPGLEKKKIQNVVVCTDPLVLFKGSIRPHKGCLGFNKGPGGITTGSQSLLEVCLFPSCWCLSDFWDCLWGEIFELWPIYAQLDGEDQTGSTGSCRLSVHLNFKAPSFSRGDGAVHECQFVIM